MRAVLLVVLSLATTSVLALGLDPVESWKTIVANGGQAKAIRNYAEAARLFTEAVSLADRAKLPIKYKEIALCRETESEILDSKVDLAERHLIELLKLVKEQKKCPLDDDVAIWMVDLAKTYQDYPNPRLHSGCLERACYICQLTFGKNRKGYWDAMLLLADYCVTSGQIDKAVQIFSEVAAEQENRFGKNPALLGGKLHELAIKSRQKHQFEAAKRLELAAIKSAEKDKSLLADGIPAFYLFLAMNATEIRKDTEAKEYLDKAVQAAGKVKTAKQVESAKHYFEPLELPIRALQRTDKLSLIDGSQGESGISPVDKSEYKQLFVVEDAVFKGPYKKYGLLMQLADKQNWSAIRCKIEHKYDQAEKLELGVVKLADATESQLSAGLPAFFYFLGINAAAKGNFDDSSKYCQKALAACRKIRTEEQRKCAHDYLDPLVEPTWLENWSESKNKTAACERLAKNYLQIQSAISDESAEKYQMTSHLVAILAAEHKYDEAERCLQSCIKCAEQPSSRYAQELSDLYMRMGVLQASHHNFDQTDRLFSKALALEKEKAGLHAARVLINWGRCLIDRRKIDLAKEKLNQALKIARGLPAAERSTTLADTLEGLSIVEDLGGNQSKAEALLKERSGELAAQQDPHGK
jgi:tetratricopeptide (TPR) repeat protein